MRMLDKRVCALRVRSVMVKVAVVAAVVAAAGGEEVRAQSSAPIPGVKVGVRPAWPAGPAWGGGPWNGSPWGPAVGAGPQGGVNQGYERVVACGYDAQGVWQVVPLYVRYRFGGVQYSVVVVNAFNPWTQSWDDGVDMPAYNTSYYINGATYSFYTPLSTGTYYFNL